MTPDEARKLMGGYATGSLTEAERTALFQAALEDQELFDELAGEQVLKEVLDEPGARQRLIAVLEPPTKHRAWAWITSAATAAIAVVIGIVVSQRIPPPPQQQVAQVLKSPESVAAPQPSPPPVTVKRKVSPPAPSAQPPPREPQAKPEADAAAQGFVAAAPTAARLRAEKEAVTIKLGFEFTYQVRADGTLRIENVEPGYLLVTANDVVIFPSRLLSEFMTVTIKIPPDTTSLVIGFSKTPGITGSPVQLTGTVARVTDQDPPNGRILIQLSLTPATR
jgi:hypothetical protein